ncbi:MAG: tetratricopeptide repeat protein [Bdellovibrionales bacterium]
MVILIFTLIANMWAADPISTAIEQAQSLALKKNRQEATAVLNKAIAAAAPPLRGRGKLIETEGAIAKVFFTDKGQRLYESGQSTMYDTPDAALNQYKEALTFEDNNILILDNIARVQLAKQDCAGAQATLQKVFAMYPFASEPAILELRTLICLKNFEAFRERLKALPTLEKGQEFYVQLLVAQDLLQQKMWRKASDILQKVAEEDPKYPETYYYLTKAGQELGHDIEGWAAKYISLCKGVALRERKHYSLEPQICAGTKEIEDVLSKKADL